MLPKSLLAALALGLVVFFASRSVDAAAPFEGEESGTYAIDSGHSSVVFRIKHLGIANFYGRFNEVAGTLVVNNEDASKSSVQVEITADSVDTNHPGRDKHVKSPDFLNVRQFPTLSFTSKKVTRRDNGNLEILGDFLMHGVTKEITVEAVHTGHGDTGRAGYKTGYEATFTVQRSDFGMKYMLEGLSDEITIIVAIEANKQG